MRVVGEIKCRRLDRESYRESDRRDRVSQLDR